ncbi:hypothetical protein WMY93_005535 [Mugilogobius chulae]|uniref:Transmembrane protein 154 n=1 Tax=Mugilogobius chulae TaxID=88201 RepID=A0AAW0PI57_9GOBI
MSRPFDVAQCSDIQSQHRATKPRDKAPLCARKFLSFPERRTIQPRLAFVEVVFFSFTYWVDLPLIQVTHTSSALPFTVRGRIPIRQEFNLQLHAPSGLHHILRLTADVTQILPVFSVFEEVLWCDGRARGTTAHNGNSMSVLWAGNMRGPRFQTRVFGWVLVLILLSGLARTEEGAEPEKQEGSLDEEAEVEDLTTETQITAEDVEPVAAEQEGPLDDEEVEATEGTDDSEKGSDATPSPTLTGITVGVTGEEFGSGRSFGLGDENDTEGTASPADLDLDPLLIVIPVVVVVLIVSIIVCSTLIHRRLNSNTRHSEVSKEDQFLEGSSTEKVPMPMFEEDVPSVLELEMEDLDDWIQKDG